MNTSTNPAPNAAPKERILRATIRVLSTNALARMQDIANEIHARKSIVHYHFLDKAALVRAACEFAAAEGLMSPGFRLALLVLAQHDEVLRNRLAELFVVDSFWGIDAQEMKEILNAAPVARAEAAAAE